MKRKDGSEQTRFMDRWIARYGIAVLAVGVGFLLRSGLFGFFDEGYPYVSYYPAVMFAAVLGGFWPGALATALSALLVDIFVLLPVGLAIESPSDIVSMVLFVLMGVFMSGVAEAYRRARRKAAQYELEAERLESMRQFRTMADSMPQLAWMAEPDGFIFWYNQRWYDYTGTTPEQMEGWGWQSVHDQELLPTVLEQWKKSIATGESFEMEFPLLGADGQFRWFLTRGAPVKGPAGRVVRWFGTNTDITDSMLAQRERETTIEFLRLVNDSTGTGDLVRAATTFFQKHSGCEAVGIRLRDGDDYPYYEYRGLSDEFVLAENSLCTCDAAGKVIFDSEGYPIVECMCGNIINGQIDASKPFFTAHGSFWSNCTTELLATSTDADRQARTRNRCNGEGYESVALLPLRLGKERLGLVQLNDRRKGVFSAEAIDLWERFADYLAVALAKFGAEEEQARQAEQLREQARLLDLAQILVRDPEDRIVMWNSGAEALYGFTEEEAIGRVTHDLLQTEFPKSREAAIEALAKTGRWQGELVHTAKDGRVIVVASHWVLHRDQSGNPVATLEVNNDITEQKRAEHGLRTALEELDVRAEELEVLNEEIRSTNEELHVANQELDVRAEEMEVLNEELQANNEELQHHITERKQAEERERELEAHKREFYQRTLQAATEGKLVICESEDIRQAAGPRLIARNMTNLAEMAGMREAVIESVRAEGMDEAQIHRFMGCAMEAAANAHKHAGGGTASLHRVADGLMFVVSDSGSGINALSLPDVALTKGYTTAVSLGMGYKVMIHFARRVYLATGPEGTTVAIEMPLHEDKSPHANDGAPPEAAWLR